MESLDLFGGKRVVLLNVIRFGPLKDPEGRFQSSVHNGFPYESTLTLRLCSHGEGVR